MSASGNVVTPVSSSSGWNGERLEGDVLSTESGNDIALIGASPFLESLSHSSIVEIASRARRLHFSTGQMIYPVGAEDTPIYWVKRGRLRITIPGRDGAALLYGMAEPGDFVGEAHAIDGGASDISVSAECAAEVLRVDRNVVLAAVAADPRASMDLARWLASQLRSDRARLAHLLLNKSEIRIWTHLMRWAERYGEREHLDGPALVIRHAQSQQDLADGVGLTRVKVNRQLGDWRERGLISDGRGFIRIPNVAALRDHVWRRSRKT